MKQETVSFPLKGFLTRRQNETKIRTIGTPLAVSKINLSETNEIIIENKLNQDLDSIYSSISKTIQSALFGDSTHLNDSYNLKSFTKQSSLISLLYEKFIQSNGSIIQINWVKNHSTLVELVQENIPSTFLPLVKPNQTTNLATFLVDVTFFLNNDSLKLIENNHFLISLLYRLSFVRGFSSFMNLSDKESFDLTLSLLNEHLYLNKITSELEISLIKSPLRIKLANFVESNSGLLNLDHDFSLTHCLKQIEASYQALPTNLYFNDIFQLEQQYLVEKDQNARELIKTCLLNCDRQVVLLIKQMDISLPYDRIEFQKSMIHSDIKLRRDLCFQLIRNFNRKTELSNIDSVITRLRTSTKYNLNQPRLVVGRESRAFGNQAYLFANSKLIQIDEKVLQQTKDLEFIISKHNLEQLLNDHVRNKVKMNYEFTNLLSKFEDKFKSFLHELVPSLGRLISLVYNHSKSSSFTQYNGVFQNLREALEIFARKSAGEVEKQRKNFIENETSTRSNFISNLRQQTDEQTSQIEDNLLFFSCVLNALTEFSGKSGQIEKSIQTIEELIHGLYSSKSGSSRAAFCVLLQRPSYTGSDRFKLNELESKPEQEEALQKLVRTGGDHLYMSPSYEWIADATDLIEAVPLFIYERTIINDGKPTTVFEVDQEGLEQTIRQIAEFWAQNIERTIESEHINLSRSILIKLTPELEQLSKQIQSLNNACLEDETNKNYKPINKEISNLLTLESLVYTGKVAKCDLEIKIGKLAKLIGDKYNKLAVQVEQVVEKAWSSQDFITRIEALERLLMEKNLINLDLLNEANRLETNKDVERLAVKAFERQRGLPAFHLLTTEAPGLIEGFITVVLEEEMAMRNVIKAYNLDDQVKDLSINIQKNLAQIAEKVIEEFGYEPIVSQHISNGVSKEQAILRVLGDNIPIQEQVASLAILTQMFNFENNQQNENISLANLHVDQQLLQNAENYWSSKINLNMESIKLEAQQLVYKRNKTEPDFVEGLKKNNLDSFEMVTQESLDEFLLNDPIYSKEAQVTISWLIRARSFEYVLSQYPDLHLKERAKCFIREHSGLLQTTCRRQVIAKNGLHDQLCHPRFAFSSGVTFESTLTSLSPNSSHLSSCTSALPTGLRKRYHLIYGPSRVNLGKDERRSVENWSQFIGVSDPLAAKHAQDVYELINYSPVVRNVREAENLKVSENQWTALVRSCRNVQAFFVERLGVGDIEDLSYQFNQRGGINLGSLKEGEGYNSGPTAGYCIPKDLLFKLFVGTHQDVRKLLQIGVPRFLHKHLLELMTQVYSRRNEFSSVGEWELWAAEQFLSKEALAKRFSNLNVSEPISDYLQRYINLSGSQIVFHLAKLIQVLGNTGVPSPLLNTGRDLHSVLWSNWSDHKITLGGEQVNRSTVFTMTREIPESAKRSRLLNPNAGVVDEESLRIQMFGVYKGDDDEPPPPDVRYSWTMRAFQILAGHYQAVADSLDLEGQVIARLSWVGFRPDSKDPRDIEATNYLLKKFSKENNTKTQMNDFIDRLKKAFPCHTTVGDITITAVPGVDSEDLLGFSAETLTLLGDEADRARQILESQGKMSIDQMKANATLRRKFPEEWTPLNQLSNLEQQRIKNLVGEAIHPLVLRLRGPGTNFITDLQGQDVVVFSITHPEILKLDPAHLRDLMLVGRPNSALCALDFVAQGRHRCWFERDVMLWYAAARSLTINGKLSFDWSKRNHFGRQSVYKAFGTGTDQYSPALGTDVRSEVVRQERRAIEIWNSANNLVNVFKTVDSVNTTLKVKLIEDALEQYQLILVDHLANNTLANEALHYQQYSQRLLMAKRFKSRDQIIQESIQFLFTTPSHQLAQEFDTIHWLSIGGIFLINGSTEQHQNEILTIVRTANSIVKLINEYKKNENSLLKLDTFKVDSKEMDLISKLIVSQLTTTRMTLGERKGEMFSVKASEDCQIRAVARRAQLALQSNQQKAISYRLKGFEKQTTSNLDLETMIKNVRQLMLDLSNTTPNTIYSVEVVNETFGQIAKYTTSSLENIIEKFFTENHLNEKENLNLKSNMINATQTLFKNGLIDLKVLDLFCGTYEDHGYLAKLLELSNTADFKDTTTVSESTEEILNVCELLYYLLALDKTSHFLTQHFSDENSDIWRKFSEFFAKTIDDHFYEYNPWILDSKRGSAFVHFYDDLGIIKNEYNNLLYETSWRHHRILYKYLNNLIQNHSDLQIRIANQQDRNLLLGLVEIGDKENGEDDIVLITAIGNHGVGEDHVKTYKNYESLWRAYNQLREIAFMRNDGIEFPVVFSSYDSSLINGLNTNNKVNLAILSPVGRTHYSRAIMESTHLNDNVFITRTGFFSNDGKQKTIEISRDKSYLFIEDAHFFLNRQQYLESLKQNGMSDKEAENRINLDEKLGRFTGKGIRVAVRFKKPVLIGCCIAHHHHPLETSLTIAGYPSTDKSPFLFDLTYNKSLYPLIYSGLANSEDVLLPAQIDWLQDETSNILDEQLKLGKTQLQAENLVFEAIKDRLRPFALEHGIIIAKGSAESGARNLSRFDIKNLNINTNGLINEDVLTEAAKFIYQVSKGQNVTIQKAIVSTPITWMSQYAVKKFIERQIIEHSVCVNIEKYPKDFIYGTLRVILSSGVPDLNDLSNPSNWEASHLLSLSSLQTATNVGRQGTLEMLSPEMIHSKFRSRFIEQLAQTGKKAMSLSSKFGPTYWNDEIYLDGSGESYKNNNSIKLDKNRILPFKLRRTDIPEKDACGVPYWWPRYLMLDIISEPIFVDENGKEISNAHIIDITLKDSKDGDDQAIFTVCDKYGNVTEAKIIDFKFWLLEPNVGIGLWPNYWKRELVRCQEHSNQVDYQQVGISDRIVLKNFLKAGQQFLNVKFKTNDLSQRVVSYPLNESLILTTNELIAPSNLASILYTTLVSVAQKYGFVSIDANQVSLWLSETLKTFIQSNTNESTACQMLNQSLEILKSITLDDLKYCHVKSVDNYPRIDVSETDIFNWLSNSIYTKRVCELMIDSILSVSLSPPLEISPIKLPSNSKLLTHFKTFAVISQKTTLFTHQIYPFIVGKGDYSLNVIGVHSDWILSESNLAKRVILYDEQTNSFIETDLESPLVINLGFIVELNQDKEVETHLKLSNEYEKANLKLINPGSLSQIKTDDKLWIRKNKQNNNIITPDCLVLTRDEILQGNNFIKLIETFLANSSRGVVVQPSANTTESYLVKWFESNEPASKILETSREIINSLSDTNVLISEFRGNVLYKESPVVFRFNVAVGKHVTCAAYVGTKINKIVGLKGTNSTTNSGYCERLDQVLKNLYEETTNKKVEFNCTKWNELLKTARQIANTVSLPLVGIDILLESNENKITPILLEVNSRPGTLIFGEELVFNQSGSTINHSLMSPPVNDDFWSNLLSNLSDLSNQQFLPKNLLEWKQLLSSEQVLRIVKNQSTSNQSNVFLSLLSQRYGINDSNLLNDRIISLTKTIDDAILSNFNLNKPISLIFSNGRDRYFGGHTDLLGLGGPTINATTENEIIALIQKSDDSKIYVTNSSIEYKSSQFNINELLLVLNQVDSGSFKLGDAVWDSNEWTSYLKGTLTYMLSSDFSAQNKVKSKLFNNKYSKWSGFRIHFNSSGRLHLQSRIGSSSSSALTSAFILGLNNLFDMQLTRGELSQTDYGEFYLGKTAGCADKTTILNAVNRELIAVSSIPERFISSISLPNSIVVIMANSNIPRLNSIFGKQYLLKSYPVDKVDLIYEWAQSIMRRFGSFVFLHSVNYLVQSLSDESKLKTVGITSEQASILLKSLSADNQLESSNKTLINFGSKTLLRELCWGGKLEKYLGFDNKYQRYNLIFRLLKLLPETEKVTIAGNEEIIHPRKSVLYGISETERCYEYVALMNSLNTSPVVTPHLNRLLDLVRWSHNGDRAVVNYRNDFEPTLWANDKSNLVTDQVLNSWILNREEELMDKSGGFERSLPEFDEWATSLDETFNKQAALRVAAAGLGGTVCVHSLNSIAPNVIAWLKKKGLSVNVVRPGPSCLVI